MDGFLGTTLLVVLFPAWPWPDSKRMRPLRAVNVTKAAGSREQMKAMSGVSGKDSLVGINAARRCH